MSNITQQLTEVLARITGMAELDALDARSNEWRSAIIDANQFLAAHDSARSKTAADEHHDDPTSHGPVRAEGQELVGEGWDTGPQAFDVIRSTGEEWLCLADPEHSRRIIACLNACNGIPTEALESKSAMLTN